MKREPYRTIRAIPLITFRIQEIYAQNLNFGASSYMIYPVTSKEYVCVAVVIIISLAGSL